MLQLHFCIYSFLNKSAISIALSAASHPLLPAFVPARSNACSIVSEVITPKTKAVVLVHMCGSMAQIDKIVEVCKKHNLILIEDTAQALGASFNGKALGTFGKVAVYSFDFFKIVSAAEGGAIITNDQSVYEIATQHADHGHSHVGNNRGMEPHPIIGTNYRISELHAAIGLAQFRKLPYILEHQRKNKLMLEQSLSKFSQVSFRKIPDRNGDSATFLDFFLPDETTTRKVLKSFDKNEVGYAYWYDNNYHYFKNWEHIKHLKTAAKLPVTLFKSPQDYATIRFPQSDNIISRLISLQIRITWTQMEIESLISKIEKSLKEVF